MHANAAGPTREVLCPPQNWERGHLSLSPVWFWVGGGFVGVVNEGKINRSTMHTKIIGILVWRMKPALFGRAVTLKKYCAVRKITLGILRASAKIFGTPHQGYRPRGGSVLQPQRIRECGSMGTLGGEND